MVLSVVGCGLISPLYFILLGETLHIVPRRITTIPMFNVKQCFLAGEQACRHDGQPLSGIFYSCSLLTPRTHSHTYHEQSREERQGDHNIQFDVYAVCGRVAIKLERHGRGHVGQVGRDVHVTASRGRVVSVAVLTKHTQCVVPRNDFVHGVTDHEFYHCEGAWNGRGKGRKGRGEGEGEGGGRGRGRRKKGGGGRGEGRKGEGEGEKEERGRGRRKKGGGEGGRKGRGGGIKREREGEEGEGKKGEGKKGEGEKGEGKKGEAEKGEAEKGEAEKGEAEKGEAEKGEAEKGEGEKGGRGRKGSGGEREVGEKGKGEGEKGEWGRKGSGGER